MTRNKMQLAVLIDADNVSSKYASAILKEITRFGDPALRRVYGDWSGSQLCSWKDEVQKLGLVAKQETANTKRKNATDIGMVIDAMDILHKGRFDGFVIVSSDGDFTALVNRLREEGVEVIGIGESKAPESFRKVCNRFVRIENIVDGADDAPESGAKNLVVTLQKDAKKEPPSKVVPLVIKAMAALESDGEWFNLSPLGTFLNRANSDFDPRNYGKSQLSDLLKATGQFEVRSTANNGLEVRRSA